MSSSEIDDSILAVAQPSWCKVAMIIARSAQKLGAKLPEADSGYDMIAGRIEVLVGAGRLVAQGDITRWRHSEVRLP